MANITLTDPLATRGQDSGRRERLQDSIFRGATMFFAIMVLALLGGVILSLHSKEKTNS